MSAQWDDSWLTADDRKAYKHPCRCSSCWPGLTVDITRYFPPTPAPQPIPARSPIGIALGVVLGLLLMGNGLTLAVLIQPAGWGTVAATLSALAGFVILARIYDVTS